MADEKEKEKMRNIEYRAESLGWLTESAVLPKKHKPISGVGAASILELKAQLYKTQEENQKNIEGNSCSRRRNVGSTDLFSQKNSGVENRAKRDKIEMKAIKDGSVNYAALEKKAELYEKLSRGELSDEEEKEKYCVDFFQKTLEQEPDRSQPSDSRDHDEVKIGDDDDDDGLVGSRVLGLGRTRSTMDRDEHKRFVREVHEEAKEEREKASSLKMRRQQHEASRRDKLRQAYLKKQLDKALLAKQNGIIDNNL